jgi:transposase
MANLLRVATLNQTRPAPKTLTESRPQGLGITVQERRWVIKRTFGTFGHNRRLARDHEGRPDVAAGWITLASAAQMLRRLAQA